MGVYINAQRHSLADIYHLQQLTLFIQQGDSSNRGFACSRNGLGFSIIKDFLPDGLILMFSQHGVVVIHYRLRLAFHGQFARTKQDGAIANGLDGLLVVTDDEQCRALFPELSDTVKTLVLKVGIAHGLGNARHLLEDIRNGHNEYHVIEIMACPGGCIGGGGQPLHHGNSDVLYARANALYREDANKPLRKSHENPYIKTLYEEYLGKPLSETAEHLLHTHYFNKSMD